MTDEVSRTRADAENHFQRAQQHAQKGRWDRAIEAARLALESDPDWDEVRYWLADVYVQQGDKRRAAHQYEQLLHRHPKDEGILKRIQAIDPMTATKLRRLADIAPDPFVAQVSAEDLADLDEIDQRVPPPELQEVGVPGAQAAAPVTDWAVLESGAEEEMVTAPPSLPAETYAYQDDLKLREQFMALPGAARALERRNALWADDARLGELTAQCQPLNATQQTSFAGAVAYAAQTLGLGVPNVLTMEDEGLCPVIAGCEMSHLIVPTGLLRTVSPSEQYFVAGHWLAHVAAGHHPLWELSLAYLPRPRPSQLLQGGLYDALHAGMGSAAELGSEGEVATLLRTLHAWSLRAELTADRGGLVCCQNTDDACLSIARLTCPTAAEAASLGLAQFYAKFAGQDIAGLAAISAEQSPESNEAYAYYRLTMLCWWAGREEYLSCLRQIGMA